MAIVNFESVAAAAESIQANGQKPSVRSIVACLGGGSPNAVLSCLREWRAGRPVVKVEDTALDAEITIAIARQIQKVAAAAASSAEERATALEDDMQAVVEALSEAEHKIVSIASELDDSIKSKEMLSKLLADTCSDILREQEKSVAYLSEIESMKHKIEQLQSSVARSEFQLESASKLADEVDRLSSALADESLARQSAERSAGIAAAKLEAQGDMIKKLETDLVEIRLELTSERDARRSAESAAQASAIAVARLEAVGEKPAATVKVKSVSIPAKHNKSVQKSSPVPVLS